MLYQQNQKIEVIVRKEDAMGATTAGANETSPEEVAGGDKKSIWNNTSKSRRHRVLKTNATHAWAVARQIHGLAINYKMGGIGYKYGDAAFQDSVQRS